MFEIVTDSPRLILAIKESENLLIAMSPQVDEDDQFFAPVKKVLDSSEWEAASYEYVKDGEHWLGTRYVHVRMIDGPSKGKRLFEELNIV